MELNVTRRTFTAALGGAAAFLAAPSILRAEQAELRVFTWEGYAEAEVASKFEAENGCKLKITYSGSVDEMFAKMQGSKGQDFDIVSFDTGSTGRYAEQNLIQPLDLSLLPGRANMIPVFQKQPALEVDGKLWGVPHAWGSLPLIYSKEAFPTAPESWASMWDPRYAQQVIALDDAINNTALAVLILGYEDPFNLTDDQLAAVKAKLIEIKKNLLSYFAGYDEDVSIFADNGVKLKFAMGEPQAKSLKERGADVAYTIPKEGGIGWIDCHFISIGVRDAKLAHKWIQACLDKSVGEIMSKKVGYGNVMDDSLNQEIGMTYTDRLKYLARPKTYDKRIKLWNDVKAA